MSPPSIDYRYLLCTLAMPASFCFPSTAYPLGLLKQFIFTGQIVAYPDAQPTVSKHLRHKNSHTKKTVYRTQIPEMFYSLTTTSDLLMKKLQKIMRILTNFGGF